MKKLKKFAIKHLIKVLQSLNLSSSTPVLDISPEATKAIIETAYSHDMNFYKQAKLEFRSKPFLQGLMNRIAFYKRHGRMIMTYFLYKNIK